MGRVDAGTIVGSGRVVYRTTVHGPVTGYAKVKGRTVAVSRKRASYGQDVLWQLAFRDLTVGKVRSAATFRDAFRDSPFTFNVGYADDQDIAMYSAGNLPVRPRSVDPRLPVKGTGEYEWRGVISLRRRPFQINPASGVLINWNNRPAPGWGAADDNWSYGSTQRVRMLEAGIAKRGVHDLASVTSAMNAAATQDLRSVALTPVVDKLLRAHPAGATPRATRMLDLLWPGGRRAPPAWTARMTAPWTPVPRPRSGTRSTRSCGRPRCPWTASRTSSGRTPARRAVHRRRLLVPREGPRPVDGDRYKDPFNERYCGGGDAAKCAAAIWKALDAVPGSPTPYARMRTRSGSRSGQGCCRPRSATRTGRAGSNR